MRRVTTLIGSLGVLGFCLCLSPEVALAQRDGCADLIVEIQQSGKGVPTSYRVKNVGTCEAGASILRVSVTLKPLDPNAASQWGGAHAKSAGTGSSGTGVGVVTPPVDLSACKAPAQDFIEPIGALKPGESKPVPAPGLFPQLPKLGGFNRPKVPPTPQYSFIEWPDCSPTVTCVFEVKAKADDTNDVAEGPGPLKEANNTGKVIVERKVS